MATAATGWYRLDSEVALADDLHLRHRSFDLVRAPTHHRVEQFPTVVGAKLEQALVDRGDRDRATGRGRLAVEGSHRNLDERLVANVIDGFFRRDLHVQSMVPQSYSNLGDAELECRLADIEHRGRLHACDSAANHQGRDENVGRPVAHGE